MSGGVKEVLCNLSRIFKNGMSYSFVNVSRSMLSSTFNVTSDGPKDIGKNPLVTRLMKGIYNAKPPTPKYIAPHRTRIVLSYFDVTARRDLLLLQLARKVVPLLAPLSLCNPETGWLAIVKLRPLGEFILWFGAEFWTPRWVADHYELTNFNSQHLFTLLPVTSNVNVPLNTELEKRCSR